MRSSKTCLSEFGAELVKIYLEKNVLEFYNKLIFSGIK